MGYYDVYISDEKQEARTPKTMMALLNNIYFKGRHVHDPCPANWNGKVDGLKVPWSKVNYVNPPFRQLPAWLDKAHAESLCGRDSIVLMPMRFTSQYFNEILCRATSVVIWFNSIAFVPFENKFPIGICTLQFGTSLKPAFDRSIFQSKPVSMDRWIMKAPILPQDILTRVKLHFPGIVAVDNVKRLRHKGGSYVFLTSLFSENTRAIIEHCQQNPDAVVVACTMVCFDAGYMSEAMPLVKQVCIYPASVSLNGRKSYLPSQVLAFSRGSIGYQQPETVRMAKVYLTRMLKTLRIRDPPTIP